MPTKESKRNWIEREVRPFTIGRTLNEPVEVMEPSDLVTAFQILGSIEKKIKARKTELRDTLINLAKQKGKVNEKGSFSHVYDGAKIDAVKTKKKIPEREGFLELLEKNNIAPVKAFDRVETLVYNPSKVQTLVETGRLDKTAVQDLCPESTSLKVKPSEQMTKLIEKASSIPSQKKQPVPVEKEVH